MKNSKPISGQISSGREGKRRSRGTSSAWRSGEEVQQSVRPTEESHSGDKYDGYNQTRGYAIRESDVVGQTDARDDHPSMIDSAVFDTTTSSDRQANVKDTNLGRGTSFSLRTDRSNETIYQSSRLAHHTQSSAENQHKPGSGSDSSPLSSKSNRAGNTVRHNTHESNPKKHHPAGSLSSDQQFSRQSKDDPSTLKTATLLEPRDNMDRLITMVGRENYAGFARSVTENTDLINRDEFLCAVRQRAVAALNGNDEFQAESCIKTLVLIDVCRNLSSTRATTFFLGLIRDDDDFVRTEFDNACRRERDACCSIPRGRFQNEMTSPRILAGNRDTGQQKRKYPQNDTPKTVDNARTPESVPRSLQAGHAGQKIDMDFPKQKPKWFQLGKLFKMWKMVPNDDPPLLPSSGDPTFARSSMPTKDRTTTDFLPSTSHLKRSSQSDEVRKIYYLVVVKEEAQSCLAIRARTYGGYGVSRKYFSPSEITAHAILYSDTIPSLRGEPRLSKRPIKVDLEHKEPPLDPAMRIDFAKTFAVPFTTERRAKAIGKVADESMGHFRQYCEEFML